MVGLCCLTSTIKLRFELRVNVIPYPPFQIRASELVDGVPGEDASNSAVADVTVTVRDVNDEAPTFDRAEYTVTIPENVPFGTPLANLDMEVRDTDTGPNALFKVCTNLSTVRVCINY